MTTIPTTAVARPLARPEQLTAVLVAARDDQLLHATAALLVYAGLRPIEAGALLVADYTLGTDPKLRVAASTRSGPRTIRIARTAATALDVYLADRDDTAAGEPLLLGAHGPLGGRCVRLLRPLLAVDDLTVHDLRRAAIATVLEDGTPLSHVHTYFGMPGSMAAGTQGPVREGYDVGIAAVLDATYTSP